MMNDDNEYDKDAVASSGERWMHLFLLDQGKSYFHI